MKRDAGGRAAYLVYVPVVEPALPASAGREAKPGHDLRSLEGDLCTKIIQAGYSLTESASKKIRIPARDVARAIGSAG